VQVDLLLLIFDDDPLLLSSPDVCLSCALQSKAVAGRAHALTDFAEACCAETAKMADDALRSFTSLLEIVPSWIADLERTLKASTERQHETLFENQPAGTPVVQSRKPSKSSSVRSKRSGGKSSTHHGGVHPTEDEPKDALLRPQLPHMTPSDALRLSQRKRKTASVLSDQSGPVKYRSKGMVVVYYDGDTQRQFETIVRAVGGSRNILRKGRMCAKMNGLSRSGSGSSSESSGGESDATMLPSKLKYKSTRSMRIPSITSAKNDGTAIFDQLDLLLEKAQSLCERAAHQILRDGDCAVEVRSASAHFADIQRLAEDELPNLRRRSEKAAQRQARLEAREKAEEEAAKKLRATPENVDEKLEDPFASPASLGVGLEADDSDGDDIADFQIGSMQWSKYGMRSTRTGTLATA